VRFDEPPEQMVVGDATALTVGAVFTVTVTVAVAVHAPVVPVTVYVVVVVGETVTVVPLNPPGFHEYVVAPDPVKFELCPAHIDVGDARAVTGHAEQKGNEPRLVIVTVFPKLSVTLIGQFAVGVTLVPVAKVDQ
jgi:hypothetical protein